MATQAPKLFDYLAKNAYSVQHPPKSATELLILALHALMKAKQFRLVSVGDPPAAVGEDTGQLPAGWNGSEGVFTFHYKHPQSNGTVVVQALSIDTALSVQCITLENPTQVYEETLSVEEFTKVTDFSKPPTAESFKNVDKLTKEFIEQIVGKLVPAILPQSASSQQPSTENKRPTQTDPLREYRPPGQWGPPGYAQGGPGGFGDDDEYGRFGVGADDLNPFTPPGSRNPHHLGGFGGGTEIGPHHPGFGPGVNDPYRGGDPFPGVPQRGGRGGGRGAPRPPGQRFDPFGPPINPKGDPDNDQLPPPGYNDMFM